MKRAQREYVRRPKKILRGNKRIYRIQRDIYIR